MYGAAASCRNLCRRRRGPGSPQDIGALRKRHRDRTHAVCDAALRGIVPTRDLDIAWPRPSEPRRCGRRCDTAATCTVAQSNTGTTRPSCSTSWPPMATAGTIGTPALIAARTYPVRPAMSMVFSDSVGRYTS